MRSPASRSTRSGSRPSSRERVSDGLRPLGGVRVLDLTRILAGPANGRTLAEHGADVLLVNSPTLDNVLPFVIDTSHGKRSTFLDLDATPTPRSLRALIADADVFAQGYRSGAMERRGLEPRGRGRDPSRHRLRDDELLRRRRTLAATPRLGTARADGERHCRRAGWRRPADAHPGRGVRLHHGLPRRARHDRGVVAAQPRGRQLSRARLACARRRAGSRASRESTARRHPDSAMSSQFLVTTATPFGELRHLAPVTQMSATQPHWALPTTPLGSHAAEWIAANPEAAAGKKR